MPQSSEVVKEPDDRSRRRFLEVNSMLGLAAAFSPGTTGEAFADSRIAEEEDTLSLELHLPIGGNL
jgi:hypothetical protein